MLNHFLSFQKLNYYTFKILKRPLGKLDLPECVNVLIQKILILKKKIVNTAVLRLSLLTFQLQ